MSPLVSLIMPTWEPDGGWLREAVASALEDHVSPLELIVVDDGSRRPVETLLEDVRDPRWRVIRTPHAGPYAARNAGFAVARGTYVRYVDSDDLVEPGSTAGLLEALAGHDDAVAYGDTLVCDEELRPLSTIATTLEGDVAAAVVLGRFDVRVVSMLFPRWVIERVGGWDPGFPVSGDWDFVLRTLEHTRAIRVDRVVTRYRRHQTSITRTADVAAGARAGLLVLESYFGRHPEQRGSALERRAYLRLHLDRAAAHAGRREYRAAAGQFFRAARRDPRATVRAAASRLRRRGAGLMAAVDRRGHRADRRRG